MDGVLVIELLNLTPFVTSPALQENKLELFSSVSMGFGQVMFQGSVVTGIIFFIAIAINSRITAVYALYGSLLGTVLAALIGLPLVMINIGLFGYNAVLCGIALGDKSWKSFLGATFAIVLTVLLNFGLDKAGIITLTAPFVLATWTVLLLNKLLKKT